MRNLGCWYQAPYASQAAVVDVVRAFRHSQQLTRSLPVPVAGAVDRAFDVAEPPDGVDKVVTVLPTACPGLLREGLMLERVAHQTAPGLAAGQATQVVSHGWHHHNRLSVVGVPSSSGLNTRAGSQQNRHAGPAPPRPWIHPVVLAVAACIPSNLGVLSTLVLHGGALRAIDWSARPRLGPTFGPRRLRRRSEPGLVATQGGAA